MNLYYTKFPNTELDTEPEIYRDIILSDVTILDVRSEGEFKKASLPNSINVPLLDDEDRHLVGIEYKEKGSGSAIKLGNKLVSGDKKQRMLKAWKEVIDEHPLVVLICHRGGLRSQITKRWITEHYNIELPRLTDGYKAFRNFLITSLEKPNVGLPSLILNGNTGSRKTDLIKRLSMAIDLEGLAEHRGSAFGAGVFPQPSQATFENRLAFELIKMKAKKPKFIVYECESKGIGSVNVPNSFYDYMYSGTSVFLELDFEDRISAIYESYVRDDREAYAKALGLEEGLELWKERLIIALTKIRSKLGKEGYDYCINTLGEAIEENSVRKHRLWIGYLLENYYDPMYIKSMNKKKPSYEKVGSADELYAYLEAKNRA